jgi:hypothetical protein
MQEKYTETSSSKSDGFLQKSLNNLNEKSQKPLFWLVIIIFAVMGLIGYGIGSTMVVQTAGSNPGFDLPSQASNSTTYVVLEVDDLSAAKPELLSIWFVHLKKGEKNYLGFTPVITADQTENADLALLKNYSLDGQNNPTHDLLNAIAKKGFPTTNYMVVDQKSSAALINWFTGKELSDPIFENSRTMTEYGKVLRSFCSTLSLPSDRGNQDFPWTKIIPEHFKTSINFTRAIENLEFLTSPNTPKCEMVPLP